jgi:2-polyprenyl-3-methyl-5-hydroxy-6-metoxy-1,4-benzoquinol methylase
MTLWRLSERDRAEIKRSAAEAAKVVLTPVEIDRYLAPSANTPYPLEFAFFLLGDIRGKTVLDLGCGTGEKIIPLIRLGAHVVALDISEEMVVLARQRLASYGIDGTSQFCKSVRLTILNCRIHRST